MQIFHNANYNFIRWRWHALSLSALVIIAGIALTVIRGLPLGIDFSGGTQLIVKFDQPVSLDRIREALPGDEVVQQYDDPKLNQVLIRLQEAGTSEVGKGLEQTSLQVNESLKKGGLPPFHIEKTDIVGPTVGGDLQRRGIYAVLASLIAITVYIGVRFRFSFAVGAIAATFHDILVTLAFLVFFRYELSLNVIAAILTITGYSVNDTIVIFDRVRENLRSMRREPLEQVVNLSVNQTLGRTIITAGTAFLSVLALYLFGGEALEGLAFTLIVGIVSGTYSTVFIASSIAIILSHRKGHRAAGAVSPASTSAPASPAVSAPAPARGKSKQKNARAAS
jgi:preprotein translocase subunit SecF